MPQINPFTLRLQVNRLVEQGQPMFAEIKVQDWLKERGHDPKDYDIILIPKMPEPGSKAASLVGIELRRRDGQPVDEWLQAEANRHA
mgnify:CR=1 FL=1